MVVKSKVKAKAKSKPEVRVKVAGMLTSKSSVKVEASRKSMSKQAEKSNAAPALAVMPEANISSVVEPTGAKASVKRTVKPVVVVKRIVNPLTERRRPVKRSVRVNQYAFMKPPGLEHAFEVGDTVEVFCDHEKNRERIRGWVKGIVVQVDNKLVAVQFRSNVYLTDGWMVPDRILWFPVTSEHIRPVPSKKAIKKELIPDY